MIFYWSGVLLNLYIFNKKDVLTIESFLIAFLSLPATIFILTYRNIQKVKP